MAGSGKSAERCVQEDNCQSCVLTGDGCTLCRAGRYEVDGYVYDASEEPKMLITGKWNESLSCQPCDLEGEPLEGTTLQEVLSVRSIGNRQPQMSVSAKAWLTQWDPPSIPGVEGQ